MNTEDRLKNMMRAAHEEGAATEKEWNEFMTRAHRSLYVRRAAVGLGAVALVVVGAFGAGAMLTDDPIRNNNNRGEVAGSPDATEPAPTSTPTPEDTGQAPVPAQFLVEMWLVGDERLSWGSQMVTTDTHPDAPERLNRLMAVDDTLTALFAEPTSPNAEAGWTTAIPPGTKLLGYNTGQDNVMTIDLSSEFASGGGSLGMQLRVAQVVYTATQFENVDAVRITIEG